MKREKARRAVESEDDFPRYVTAEERQRKAKAAQRKLEQEGEALQPVVASARGIATTFWGRAWCRNLEAYSDYESRLPRGRSYLRNGAVLDLRIARGEVRAKVQGSELYELRVVIQPLEPASWARIKKDCAGGIASALDLLRGRLSEQVMRVITAPGAGLFPEPGAIRMDCSCPDWADLCKHAAAVLYGVGVRLDERPELLFLLRGVDHLELMAGAARAVADQAGAAPASGVAQLADHEVADVFGIEWTEGA